MDLNTEVKLAGAGRQDYVRDADGMPLKDAGALAAGTYKYALSVGGAGNVDVTLTMSAHTGTVPTAKLYAAFLDASQKGTAVNMPGTGSLADNVPAPGSLPIAPGTLTRTAIVEITVPASSTATFSRAEWAAQ